jgi:hypothetical protein
MTPKHHSGKRGAQKHAKITVAGTVPVFHRYSLLIPPTAGTKSEAKVEESIEVSKSRRFAEILDNRC